MCFHQFRSVWNKTILLRITGLPNFGKVKHAIIWGDTVVYLCYLLSFETSISVTTTTLRCSVLSTIGQDLSIPCFIARLTRATYLLTLDIIPLYRDNSV